MAEISLDILNINNNAPSAPVSKTLSIEDALIQSLNKFGKVDMHFIVDSSKTDLDSVLKTLGDSVYQNPQTWSLDPFEGWELKSEYLCGNIQLKLNRAKIEARNVPGRFTRNIQALEAALPKYLSVNNIYVSLGSPWIPVRIVSDFLKYLNGDEKRAPFISHITHNKETGTWFITNKETIYNPRLSSTYGTKRMSAFDIIEHMLNNTDIEVFRTYIGPDGKKHKSLDLPETLQANEKAKVIKDEFNKWIYRDSERTQIISEVYTKKFGTYIRKEYNGDFLTFPEKNPEITLRDYQKNAIARMILSNNTLLAHDTGSGKTFELIAAGNEMLRMGLSTKNLYVVPNGIITDWEHSFYQLYPNTNLFVVDPSKFVPSKREETLKTIASDQYNVVLMAMSCFDSIPVSKDAEIEFLDEKIAELEATADSYYQGTRGAKVRLNSYKKRRTDLYNTLDDEVYSFDKLGFTRLFVDEAHNYKNLGVSNAGSEGSSGSSHKCESFFQKVRHIQSINDGKGVVLATATPLTNSLCELFVMQTYLQRGELKLLGIDNFASWINNYAEKEMLFELSVNLNEFKQVSRYTKFHNLRELQNLLSYIIDFHEMDTSDGLPNFEGYTDITLEKSKGFEDYLKEISKRADDIKSKRVSVKDDNYLKITNDGRKSALDLRLIGGEDIWNNIYFLNQDTCKLDACSDKILEIYKEFDSSKATQLVFSDLSIPSKQWNVYEELKRLLVSKGIPSNEVAFIQDYDTPKRRDKLVKMVNNGDIRVLIGSTFKLGTGMNVQKRLVAIHHLDVPWRPSDMVQREGRLIRFGNTNENVRIVRYILKGSFDAFLWQTLERKERFITGLLSSRVDDTESEDIGDSVLDYAQIKTLAIGNKEIKERFEVENEIRRLQQLDAKENERKTQLMGELSQTYTAIKSLETRIANLKVDRATYKADVSGEQGLKEIANYLYRNYRYALKYSEERYIGTYRGFKLYKPLSYDPAARNLRIAGTGDYTIEVGQSALGLYQRLENFFERMDRILKDYEAQVTSLNERIKAINETKFTLHNVKINLLKKRLKDIDDKLAKEKLLSK